MSKELLLSQERLKELLDYSPETGRFHWRVSVGVRTKAGDAAGCVNALGYVVIRINRIGYYAHRLAWLYMTGSFPSKWIDHINHDRKDNRFSNLRDVSGTINNFNRKGVKGYYKTPEGRYEAGLKSGYKKTYLGTYDTEEEARNAHLRAKRAATEESHH